jgi:hypothetical protein
MPSFRPAPPPGCAGRRDTPSAGRPGSPRPCTSREPRRPDGPGPRPAPGLVGGAEPESVWEYRLVHVAEVPLVELGPGPGVAERGRVGLIAVRRPSLQGDRIGGARRHRTLEVRRRPVVPVDHLVHQPGVAGMDLIGQIGAGDVLHRPVAPPHLVRQIGPAPRHQGDRRPPGAPGEADEAPLAHWNHLGRLRGDRARSGGCTAEAFRDRYGERNGSGRSDSSRTACWALDQQGKRWLRGTRSTVGSLGLACAHMPQVRARGDW